MSLLRLLRDGKHAIGSVAVSREDFLSHVPSSSGGIECYLPGWCPGLVVAVLRDGGIEQAPPHRRFSIFRFRHFFTSFLRIYGFVARDTASRPAPGRATPSNHFLAATQAASTSSIHQPPFSGALSPLLPPHDSAPRHRTGRRPLWTGTIARRPHRSRHATASVDSARRISLSPLRIPPWRPHLGGAEGSYWLHHSHAHALRGRPSLG